MADWKLALLGLAAIAFTAAVATAFAHGMISIHLFLALALGIAAVFVVIANVPWAAIRFALHELRSEIRASRGLCPRCGYNLTGNTSGVCPECGTPTARQPRVR